MKRILVPCDFSEPAREAYKLALGLAERATAEVHLLKAIDIPIMYESTFGVQPYAFDAKLLDEMKMQAESSFKRLADSLPAPMVKVHFHVEYGPVTSTIRTFIDDNAIDLVVMGTHGASGWQEYFVGSTTERVVRYSPVPVISVKKAPEIANIKNIVFATTLDLHQQTLLEEVKMVQKFFNATLHVLLVNTPTNFKSDPELKEQLDKFAQHYGLTDYTLNMRNDVYEIDGIISFAAEINADMIAMATHGRRGLLHLLTGSVAEDVANHCNCLLWTWSLHRKHNVTKREPLYETNFSSN